MFLVLRHSAENWSLTMAAFALDENLCFTRELSAFLWWVAMLPAVMTTIRSCFFAHFSTWVMFVCLLTALFMTLDSTFMSTWEDIVTLVQAKCLPPTNSFDVFLATSAFHNSLFEALTLSIMTNLLAFMSTIHLSFADIIALGYNCPTHYWWP